MKLLIIGDVHLSDRPPSIRTEGYTEQILDKLRFAVEEAGRLGVDAVVQAGDLFHIKSPSRTSHALVQRTADVLGASPAPVFVVPGNHDMSHDRLESLDSQPLGALVLHPNIDLLVGSDPRLPGVHGIPYLARWSDLPGFLPAEEVPLVVAHAPIFRDGAEPPFEHIAASDWASMVPAAATYFGHIHTCDGVFEAGGAVFCNQGALSRGSLHEESLRREPAVTLYEDGAFLRIGVPHLPVESVFRWAEKEAADRREFSAEEFRARIEATVLSSLSVEAVLARAKSSGLPDPVVRVVEDVLDEVS